MDPITATYAQDDADWTITVAGLGKEFSARAPGIIAARDRADQMVEKVTTKRAGRTVVHLLNGSAFDFTAAYMQARLTRTATPDAQPEPPPAKAGRAQGKAKDAKAGKPTAIKKARATEASPKEAGPQRARSAAPRKPRQAAVKGGSEKPKATPAKKRAEVDGALSGEEAMPAAKSGSA